MDHKACNCSQCCFFSTGTPHFLKQEAVKITVFKYTNFQLYRGRRSHDSDLDYVASLTLPNPGTIDTKGGAFDVTVNGNYAYVAISVYFNRYF